MADETEKWLVITGHPPLFAALNNCPHCPVDKI